MSIVSPPTSPVRAPFPPHSISHSDQPLDRYIADQAAWYLALGSARGLLVAEAIQQLAREVRCCTTPGKALTVDEFLDRRACLDDQADGWPSHGSWVDSHRYATAD